MFYDLTCGLCWRMFHVHVGRTYILPLLGGVLCRCLLCLVGSECCSNFLFLYLLSSCSIHYWKQGIEGSSDYWIICLSPCVSFCFMYLGALLLCAYGVKGFLKGAQVIHYVFSHWGSLVQWPSCYPTNSECWRVCLPLFSRLGLFCWHLPQYLHFFSFSSSFIN